MYRLKSKDYFQVIPLLNQINYNHIFALMVAQNQVNGEVYVDCIDKPTVCFVIHQYGMAFLCGDPNNDIFIHNLISYLKSQTPNKPKWVLIYPEKWESILDLKLADCLIKIEEPNDNFKVNEAYFIKTERVNFKYNNNNNISVGEVPSGFTLKQVDSSLFLKIEGSVVPKYFWNSSEEFLENSIGFVLMKDDQIISTCFASYITNTVLELGIETSEEFRQKGFSIYPTKALIDYCLENNYEPIWSCRKENVPSFKSALRLGFTPFSYHPYYTVTRK